MCVWEPWPAHDPTAASAAGPGAGWHSWPRNYVPFQQAPHTCGSAQPADPRVGAVCRVGESIHSSAGSPWIPCFCSL